MNRILFHHTEEDIAYLPFLKKVITAGTAQIILSHRVPVSVTEIWMAARERGITQVATTSDVLLKLLIKSARKKNSVIDYAGSIIPYKEIEFLILPPVQHLVSTGEGEFLYKRYFSKFLAPQKWLQIPQFSWELFDPSRFHYLLSEFQKAYFISCDIETGREQDRIITCVSYTAVFLHTSTNSYSCLTVCIPFTDEYNLATIKAFATTAAPKIFQNGKYDNAYLLRFGIITYNYAFDTINLFHSWYSELPKDLGFITAFMIRNWQYWKDEADTTDRMEYYRYNAKDAFTTAIDFLALLHEIPQWAWQNYLLEFPLTFPCILTELTGLKRDTPYMEDATLRFEVEQEKKLSSLRKMIDSPTYNPNSWQQTLKVFSALGSEDVKSTDDQHRDIVAHRHPLNMRLMNSLKEYKEDGKVLSTYLRDKKSKTGQQKTWFGRIFYNLNPFKTDTARLASSESQFWCGWQIQNFPRDDENFSVRKGVIADPGFFFGEADYSQNETWGTAYLSGDKNLVKTIEDRSKDFHGLNIQAFFGVPYEQVVETKWNEEEQEWVHKTLDKALRDTGKRTNHGANYNMSAPVLLSTMGIAAVLRARKLLQLPRTMSLLAVCQYLLDTFDTTYPVVRGEHYKFIRKEIATKQMLVGPDSWTRYCFGRPAQNKRDMNRYGAHRPQSLAATQLNKAYLRVFYEVALPFSKDFKLGPQIHDSILFQYRRGRIDLAYRVRDCMINPLEVTDIFGIKRWLNVPIDLKGEGENWSEMKSLSKREPNYGYEELLVTNAP